MKYLLTCLVLGFAFAAGAQTGLVEFPYNPDSDQDDVIGTADLLSLLSLYGSEFSEEALYLNEDESFATMHMGSKTYVECIKACSDLPGHWRVASLDDASTAGPEAFGLNPSGNNWVWLRMDESLSRILSTWDNMPTNHLPALTHSGYVNNIPMNEMSECGCSIHEWPRIEYHVKNFEGQNGADHYYDFEREAYINSMAELGWQILGNFAPEIQYGSQDIIFWRLLE